MSLLNTKGSKYQIIIILSDTDHSAVNIVTIDIVAAVIIVDFHLLSNTCDVCMLTLISALSNLDPTLYKERNQSRLHSVGKHSVGTETSHQVEDCSKMKMEHNKNNSTYKLVLAVVLCFLINLTLSSVIFYGWTIQHSTNEELRNEIASIRKLCTVNVLEENTGEMIRNKREVISSSKLDLSSLLRGPAGPIGPPGAAGKDGRDGKDFSSLNLLHQMINETLINETVIKEWTQLSSRLSTYGGAVFVRWGRNSCPANSDLIYKGQMAGPDYRSSGGGSNYQCLPDDPEYGTKVLAAASSLRLMQYADNPNVYGKSLYKHRAPCSVCEAKQRVTKLMIPAKTRCPSSDWTLEYRGYIMAELEHNWGNPTKFEDSQYRSAGMYVCVDDNAESLSYADPYGGVLHTVRAGCTGQGDILHCPPYKSDKSALSCVVCTK